MKMHLLGTYFPPRMEELPSDLEELLCASVADGAIEDVDIEDWVL